MNFVVMKTCIDESRSQMTCLIHRMLALQQKEPDFYTDETIKAALQVIMFFLVPQNLGKL